jgi:hypothetical protein
MNHDSCFNFFLKKRKSAAREQRGLKLLLVLALLAVLIGNAAGSLACRLAGSLALAASACHTGFSHISCCNSLDPLHFTSS